VGLRARAPLPPAAPPAVAAAAEPGPLPDLPERDAVADQATPAAPPPAEPPAAPALPAPSGGPAEPAPAVPAEQGSLAGPERMGIVQFDIKPGGVISLEGRKLGVTPLGPVQMPAGTYNFMVTNQRINKQVSMRVEVKADDVTYVQLDLRSDAGPLPSRAGSDSPAR